MQSKGHELKKKILLMKQWPTVFMMSLEYIIKIIRKVIRNFKKTHSDSSSTQLYKADTAFYNTYSENWVFSYS